MAKPAEAQVTNAIDFDRLPHDWRNRFTGGRVSCTDSAIEVFLSASTTQ